MGLTKTQRQERKDYLKHLYDEGYSTHAILVLYDQKFGTHYRFYGSSVGKQETKGEN